MSESKWYLRTQNDTFGPEPESKLVEWARLGRIQPGQVFGPFNRAVVIGLFKYDSVARTAKAYRLHEFAVDEDPPPVEKIVEKEVVKEVRVEVPPPARTELVVAEVVEPVADTPPPRAPGSIFGNASHEQLAALEAAARRELSSANRRHMSFGLFGGKRK